MIRYDPTLVDLTSNFFGLNIFIPNQFIQYNTIVNHTNIRIRMEAKAYQVLLLYNIFDKVYKAMTSVLHNTSSWAKTTLAASWLYLTETKVSYNNDT